MSYQRTEYADKTLSMNSLADRKLRLKLGSIDSHKETIAKEMIREKKKLQKELIGIDEQMKTRLSVADPNRSPRLPRRFSTPPELLSASLPASALSELKRSPIARRKLTSESCNTDIFARNSSGVSSPTGIFLKAPFDQPRRQSLPPIGDGCLLNPESPARRDRRSSFGGGLRSPLLTSPTSSNPPTPRSLSRKGSSLNEQEMSEVTAKVSRFLEKIDNNKEQTEGRDSKNEVKNVEKNNDESNFDHCQQEILLQQSLTKTQGTFQPLNFE